VVVITGGITEDSVDRRPRAVVGEVAVVAGAVSSVLVPKGEGRDPRGWVKAGTSEKRLDRAADGGFTGSGGTGGKEVESADGCRVDEGAGDGEDESDDGTGWGECDSCEAAAAEDWVVWWAWSRDSRWVAELRR
jgi:hypothetical protein